MRANSHVLWQSLKDPWGQLPCFLRHECSAWRRTWLIEIKIIRRQIILLRNYRTSDTGAEFVWIVEQLVYHWLSSLTINTLKDMFSFDIDQNLHHMLKLKYKLSNCFEWQKYNIILPFGMFLCFDLHFLPDVTQAQLEGRADRLTLVICILLAPACLLSSVFYNSVFY